MGIKGKRIINGNDEPTLLGDLQSILAHARQNGFLIDGKMDIESLVKSNNIELQRSVLSPSISGTLKYENGKWVITVNSLHSLRRQRFTIAHEFAHYILHRNENEYFQDETFFRGMNDSSIEFTANKFAASLLMPEDVFNEKITSGIVKIVDLADVFDVSIEALKLRAKELGFKIGNRG